MSTQLKKVLGFWPVFGACFGIAIRGSTIMLFGNIVGMGGMPIISSQLIALGVMILVALAFSKLGTLMPVAGGIQAYTRKAMGMGPAMLAACKEVPAVYLHAFGGAGTLIAKSVESVEGVYKLDFGVPEAMWVIRVKDFPVVVTIDAHGNSLHADIEEKSRELFAQLIAH